MSYLDTPRIHFAGQFFTDPSTINNATENYNLTEVYNNNPPSPSNPNSVWWNKDGQAFFKIQPGTKVTSAFDKTGQQSPNDPVVNAQIVSVIAGGPPTPQFGRLVDLDPDQQSRSMIVGLRLQLTIPAGASGQSVTVTGTIRPMTILDLWGRSQGGSPGSITFAGAMYQSVMDDVEWTGIDATSQTVLGQLMKASPKTLSIKLVVDSYNGDITTGNLFGLGRVVGTIGPYFDGEPAHFLAQRRLFLNAESVVASPMNNAPFQVAGNKLIIDLGNSVPTTQNPNGTVGPFMDLGKVEAVIDPLFGNVALPQPIFASAADYTTQYNLTAGIFELDLDKKSAQLLQSKPLAIRINAPAGTQSSITGLPATRIKEGLTVAQSGATPQPVPPASIALAEFQDGHYVDVDFNGLRLQKNAPAWDANANTGTEITSNVEIPLVATLWGARVPNMVIAVSPTLNYYQFPDSDGNPYQINNNPPNPNNPANPVSFTTPVITDAQGQANLTFNAAGLDAKWRTQRRKDIDSQLYLFDFSYSRYDSSAGQVQPITLLVFEDTPVVTSPTWWQNIYPIFLQYAKLYPAMRDLIDLSDYASVTNSAFSIPEKIKAVLNLPMAHPGYMPVTRDLSLVNRQMIMNWFNSGMPEGQKPTKKKPSKKKPTKKPAGKKAAGKKASAKKKAQH